jgi:ketosteroid isomerase-like protein
MRKSITLLLFLCFAPVLPAVGQDKSEGTASLIRSLEQKWADSYRQRQVAILSSLLADDFVITVEDGSTYGKLGYISHTAAPSTRVDVADFSDLKVRVHGNIAVITGSYHERGESGGAAYDFHDRFTDVWMNIDGKWQVIASHYSVPAK